MKNETEKQLSEKGKIYQDGIKKGVEITLKALIDYDAKTEITQAAKQEMDLGEILNFAGKLINQDKVGGKQPKKHHSHETPSD